MQLTALHRPVRKKRRMKMPVHAGIRRKQPHERSHVCRRFAQRHSHDQSEVPLVRSLGGERKPIADGGELERRFGIRSSRGTAKRRSNQSGALSEEHNAGCVGTRNFHGGIDQSAQTDDAGWFGLGVKPHHLRKPTFSSQGIQNLQLGNERFLCRDEIRNAATVGRQRRCHPGHSHEFTEALAAILKAAAERAEAQAKRARWEGDAGAIRFLKTPIEKLLRLADQRTGAAGDRSLGAIPPPA